MKSFILFIIHLVLLHNLCVWTVQCRDTFNVLDFGAVADRVTEDNKAFEKAWKAACDSTASRATMVVPSNRTFLLQPLTFSGPCKSNSIHVLINGTLIAHEKPEKWECIAKGCKQWIAFDDFANGLYISGSGTIDGRGSKWWERSYCKNDKYKKSCSHKPTGFVISNSNNVHIRGLTFLDSPQMHIAIERSHSVYVSNLTINAPANSPNTDGIHIQHSNNVFIDHTKIGTGDDCISIGPSSHINISKVDCGPGHGISVGSLGKNGEYDTVEYVYVSDVNFNGSTNGARIKSWQGGHGYARNIVFERINVIGTERPIIIDQFYCDHTSCHNQTTNVQVSDIWFHNIRGTSSSMVAVRLACSQSLHCKNINMKDINIRSTNAVKHTTTSSYCINVQGKLEGHVLPPVPCLNY